MDTNGVAVLLFNVSSNTVLFTKKSGTWKITSEGLSNLKPFGRLGFFNVLATISSACRSVIGLPASSALDMNTFFALSIASLVGV